jgi:hypothetical protein
MGYIWDHDVKFLKNKYSLRNFVETGTYKGDAILYVSQFNFEKYYTVELNDIFIQIALEKFNGIKNFKIFKGSSSYCLKTILRELNGCPTLFWLDAHLPDIYPETNDEILEEDLRFPLINELNTILKNRNISNDCFIIDDLRLYEDLNYEKGNIDDARKPKNQDLSKVIEKFEHTHNIIKSLNSEGFLIFEPKGD